MATGESPALEGVRALFQTGTATGATDRELLQRVVKGARNGAESAFQMLIARHGPMVLGVCRRVLRDPNDVDDAFQATFLVLARKAETVRVNDSLGRWLYGVSRRVAERSRAGSAKRSHREGRTLTSEPAQPEIPDRRDLLATLDEEVARLPAHYRAVVVLCDLDGLTHEAAARELGCAVGTVASRVSRAREKLKARLERRGYNAEDLASPIVPLALLETTARALRAGAFSKTATAGIVSASVNLLVETVLKELTMMKWKLVGLGLLSVVTVGGLGTVAAEKLADKEEPPKVAAVKEAIEGQIPGVDIPLAAPKTFKIGDMMIVEALEALPARPLSVETVVRSDGTISLGYYGDVYVFGMNRIQVKVKVIEHLKKYLPDDVLGLTVADPREPDKDGEPKVVSVSPANSDRLFVEEIEPGSPVRRAAIFGGPRILGGDRRGVTPTENVSDLTERVADHERRILDLEVRLQKMSVALEAEKSRKKITPAPRAPSSGVPVNPFNNRLGAEREFRVPTHATH